MQQKCNCAKKKQKNKDKACENSTRKSRNVEKNMNKNKHNTMRLFSYQFCQSL